MIHHVHQGLGNNVKAVAVSSHLERTSTYQKVSSRFYWYTIVNDVADYIKGCDNCQKHLSMPRKVKEELKNVAVPSQVMKKLGLIFAAYQVWIDFNISLFVQTTFLSGLKLNQSMINLHQQFPSFFMSLFASMAVLLSK